jgi:catalase
MVPREVALQDQAGHPDLHRRKLSAKCGGSIRIIRERDLCEAMEKGEFPQRRGEIEIMSEKEAETYPPQPRSTSPV